MLCSAVSDHMRLLNNYMKKCGVRKKSLFLWLAKMREQFSEAIVKCNLYKRFILNITERYADSCSFHAFKQGTQESSN